MHKLEIPVKLRIGLLLIYRYSNIVDDVFSVESVIPESNDTMLSSRKLRNLRLVKGNTTSAKEKLTKLPPYNVSVLVWCS